jgi:hypothetical protein
VQASVSKPAIRAGLAYAPFRGETAHAQKRVKYLLWVVLILAPGLAQAQSSINGVVKDTSGAVLPWVHRRGIQRCAD